MKQLVYSITILVFSLSCKKNNEQNVVSYIDHVQATFAPDRRTALFQVEVKSGNPCILIGETNIPAAKDSLINLLDFHHISFIDSIQVLPDEKTERPFALVNVSVANLRKEPRHSAELTTQALLGWPVNVLKEERGWCLVQTPDNYIAWTNAESLTLCNREGLENYKKSRKIIYTQTTGFALDTLQQNRISDLVAGNILLVQRELAQTWTAAYPDGRIAMITKTEATEWENWIRDMPEPHSGFSETALQFKGIPYLWGGTSAKALDCSGFTKTVYMLHGILLPRDASQQVMVGEEIDSTGDFSKLQEGDLLFFGSKTDGKERVVHVGLWLGNSQFIHASGDVHISSMDPADAHYDDFNRKRYLRSKRITDDIGRTMATFLFDSL